MYKIYTHKRVDKFLEKHLDVASKFVSCFWYLQNNPRSKQLDVKVEVNSE